MDLVPSLFRLFFFCFPSALVKPAFKRDAMMKISERKKTSSKVVQIEDKQYKRK